MEPEVAAILFYIHTRAEGKNLSNSTFLTGHIRVNSVQQKASKNNLVYVINYFMFVMKIGL